MKRKQTQLKKYILKTRINQIIGDELMKKKTCRILLSTILLGTLSPTIRVISETSSVNTKESSTVDSSESAKKLLSQSSFLSTISNTIISNSTNSKNQVLHKSQGEIPKELLTTTVQEQKATNALVEESTLSAANIASGTFGTSAWRIDSNGALYIGAGEFSDTPLNQGGDTSSSPWVQWRSLITSIHFEAPVIASDSLNNLFDNIPNLHYFSNGI